MARVQADVQTVLLARFDAAQNMAAYVQTDAGRKFLSSLTFEREAPLAPTLDCVRWGIVIMFLGGALCILRSLHAIDPDAIVPGILALALGVGFEVAAFSSWYLYRTLGLTEPRADRNLERRENVMAVMERTPRLVTLILDEAQTRVVDEASFRALYDSTSPPLRAYLLHVCRRPDVADDLLQETYCRWLMRRHPVMDESQTRSYLFRIATNLLHDRVRSGADKIVPEMPERGAAPNIEARLDVRSALRQLKPRERELLWLAYVEGMTPRRNSCRHRPARLQHQDPAFSRAA